MGRLKYLYCIIEPKTQQVVYVGQTYHPKQRYREHLRGPLKVDEWMREVVACGSSPELIIAGRTRTRANEMERELIQHYEPQLNEK